MNFLTSLGNVLSGLVILALTWRIRARGISGHATVFLLTVVGALGFAFGAISLAAIAFGDVS